MTIYMSSFLIILIIYLVLKAININNNKKDDLILKISFLVLVLIYGLKDRSVGTDTSTYLDLYYYIGQKSFLELSSIWTEYGYNLFNKIIYMISESEQLFLLSAASFIIGSTIYFIKKNSVNKLFSLYLYISFMFYFSSMNIMRQFIAIGIIYFSIEFLIKNSNKKFLIGIFIACLFHESAIIALVFYFIKNFKINIKKAIIISVFILGALKIGFIELIVAKTSFNEYITSDLYLQGNWGNAIIYISIFIFVMLISILSNKRSINVESEKNIMEYKRENIINWAIFFSMIFQLCATQIYIFSRISNYFMPFIIIAIPNSIYKINDKKIRFLAYVYIILATLIYMYIYILKGGQGVIPYKFYWT